MKYRDGMQKIDTVEVLKYLNVNCIPQSVYMKFKCGCESEVGAFETVGDKKNLCPD